MTFRRGLFLLPLALVAAALLAPEASARPACVFNGVLSSPHFTIHWDPTDASTECPEAPDFHEPQAGDALAAAEASYSLWVVQRGFPAPVDDGDGRMDLYVYDTDPYIGIFGDDGAGLPGTVSGWVALNGVAATEAHWAGAAAFYGSTLAVWGVWQEWFSFGTAEWAGLTSSGFPEFASLLEKPDIALDCYDSPCDSDLFYYNGQARWPFFQYLTDRFGDDVVLDTWKRVASRGAFVPDGVGALQDVIAGKGTTLTGVFNDFAAALAAGTVKAPSLAAVSPAIHATVNPGTVVNSVTTTKVAVNHLAARFVALVPGSGVGTICHPATLRIDVTLPAGAGARPSFYAREYGGLKSFSVSGSTATLTTPWDTCTWADGRQALVALPNPSTTLDGSEFTVKTTLTAVDVTTVLSPDAPVAVPEDRPTIPTADAVPPPTLTFFGASTVPVAKDGSVTLAFFATNGGSVQVSAGGKRLKTVRVKAGQNVLRLKLPVAKRTKAKAKRSALAARPSRLELTAISPSGQVGKTFSRKLRYAA